jgi:hypothetical protein
VHARQFSAFASERLRQEQANVPDPILRNHSDLTYVKPATAKPIRRLTYINPAAAEPIIMVSYAYVDDLPR